MDFESALNAHNEYAEIDEVVSARKSKRKARRLARMEAHARVHLGLSPTEAVDWSKVDWSQLLKFFMTILPFILKLI